MPLPKELSFKSGAKYAVGQAFSDSYTSTEREQLHQLLVSPDIFVSRSAAFSVKYLDLYYKYEIPAAEGNIDAAHRWHNSQMDFWQTQLNFVTWCATTGCGVSVHDHLNGRYDFAPESAQRQYSNLHLHSPNLMLVLLLHRDKVYMKSNLTNDLVSYDYKLTGLY